MKEKSKTRSLVDKILNNPDLNRQINTPGTLEHEIAKRFKKKIEEVLFAEEKSKK